MAHRCPTLLTPSKSVRFLLLYLCYCFFFCFLVSAGGLSDYYYPEPPERYRVCDNAECDADVDGVSDVAVSASPSKDIYALFMTRYRTNPDPKEVMVVRILFRVVRDATTREWKASYSDRKAISSARAGLRVSVVAAVDGEYAKMLFFETTEQKGYLMDFDDPPTKLLQHVLGGGSTPSPATLTASNVAATKIGLRGVVDLSVSKKHYERFAASNTLVVYVAEADTDRVLRYSTQLGIVTTTGMLTGGTMTSLTCYREYVIVAMTWRIVRLDPISGDATPMWEEKDTSSQWRTGKIEIDCRRRVLYVLRTVPSRRAVLSMLNFSLDVYGTSHAGALLQATNDSALGPYASGVAVVGYPLEVLVIADHGRSTLYTMRQPAVSGNTPHDCAVPTSTPTHTFSSSPSTTDTQSPTPTLSRASASPSFSMNPTQSVTKSIGISSTVTGTDAPSSTPTASATDSGTLSRATPSASSSMSTTPSQTSSRGTASGTASLSSTPSPSDATPTLSPSASQSLTATLSPSATTSVLVTDTVTAPTASGTDVPTVSTTFSKTLLSSQSTTGTPTSAMSATVTGSTSGTSTASTILTLSRSLSANTVHPTLSQPQSATASSWASLSRPVTITEPTSTLDVTSTATRSAGTDTRGAQTQTMTSTSEISSTSTLTKPTATDVASATETVSISASRTQAHTATPTQSVSLSVSHIVDKPVVRIEYEVLSSRKLEAPERWTALVRLEIMPVTLPPYPYTPWAKSTIELYGMTHTSAANGNITVVLWDSNPNVAIVNISRLPEQSRASNGAFPLPIEFLSRHVEDDTTVRIPNTLFETTPAPTHISTLSQSEKEAVRAVATTVSAVTTVSSASALVGVTSAALSSMLAGNACSPSAVRDSSDSMSWVSNPAGMLLQNDNVHPVLGNAALLLAVWVTHVLGAAIPYYTINRAEGTSVTWIEAAARVRWPSLSTLPTVFLYHAIVSNAARILFEQATGHGSEGGETVGTIAFCLVAILLFGVGPTVLCVSLVPMLRRAVWLDTCTLEYHEGRRRHRHGGDVGLDDASAVPGTVTSTLFLSQRYGLMFEAYRPGSHFFLAVELTKHTVISFVVNLHLITSCEVQFGLMLLCLTLFFLVVVVLQPRKQRLLNMCDAVLTLLQLVAVAITVEAVRKDKPEVASNAVYVYVMSYVVVAVQSVLSVAYFIRQRVVKVLRARRLERKRRAGQGGDDVDDDDGGNGDALDAEVVVVLSHLSAKQQQQEHEELNPIPRVFNNNNNNNDNRQRLEQPHDDEKEEDGADNYNNN
eukprot:PhM_4_TR2851/c1_g1_i1/m.31447